MGFWGLDLQPGLLQDGFSALHPDQDTSLSRVGLREMTVRVWFSAFGILRQGHGGPLESRGCRMAGPSLLPTLTIRYWWCPGLHILRVTLLL